MSQSPCVDLGYVYKCTKMRWIVSVGVMYNALAVIFGRLGIEIALC